MRWMSRAANAHAPGHRRSNQRHCSYSDWYAAIGDARYDLIALSNPPYMWLKATGTLQQGDLRFEPHSALVAGAERPGRHRGAIVTRRTGAGSAGGRRLADAASTAIDQGEAVRGNLLQQATVLTTCLPTRQDLAGHPSGAAAGRFMNRTSRRDDARAMFRGVTRRQHHGRGGGKAHKRVICAR